MPFGYALGKNSYSFGIHRIRIKVHQATVFLGIRSRNILHVPSQFNWGCYDMSPSTYDWSTHSSRLRNGKSELGGLRSIQRNNGLFVLKLICDEHRLSIVNEVGTKQDEIEVDHLHAPFPWCLFVQLSTVGGHASVL